MNLSFRSRTFIVRVFSASASCARALSTAPMRSTSRDSRSAESIRAIFCPARDRLALAHGELGDVAGDLRLDDRLANRLQRPGYRQPARERRALDVSEVGWRELQRRPARPLSARRRRDASTPAARRRRRGRRPATRRPAPPMMRRRVMRMVIDSPSRPRRSRCRSKGRRPRVRRTARRRIRFGCGAPAAPDSDAGGGQ